MSENLIAAMKEGASMPAMTIRNIPDETHRAIKARAATHGRSAEAEVRAILQEAFFPPGQMGFGERLHAVFADLGGLDLDVERDKTPIEPIDLS